MSMNYLTPKRSLDELGRETRRTNAALSVAEIMFVKAAQEQQLDEMTISEYPDLFVEWDENFRGKAGTIVQDEGQLYRSIHDIKDAGQNRKPSETPSMWTLVGNPLEEFPEWVQPLGVHDAYAQGAKVSHGGKRWVSDVNANTWEPGVAAWSEYAEPAAAQEEPQEPAEGPEPTPGE